MYLVHFKIYTEIEESKKVEVSLMYVRNLLNAGEYFIPVPLGIPVTVRYNERGKLEKFYTGYADDSPDRTDEFKDLIRKHHIINLEIPIKDGTTWVSGVLYTHETFIYEGNLPDVIIEPMLRSLKQIPERFTFYAGSVRSTATSFHGSGPIRQWLQMSGFKVLPGFLMPAKVTKDTFIRTVDVPQFTDKFKFPLIMYYIIFRGFRGTGVEFHGTGLKQLFCGNILPLDADSITSSGQILGTIQSSEGQYTFDYNLLQRFGVHGPSAVVLDQSGAIIYCCNVSGEQATPTDNLICPVCGKKISSNVDPAVCDDPHCMSRQYNVIRNFLECHHLPELEYSNFQNLIKSAQLQDFSDILDVQPYNSFGIQTTLSKLLRSIIPVEAVSDNGVITSFVNQCNNSEEVLLYYVSHPSLIRMDLKVVGAVESLIKWLSDPYNDLLVHQLLDHERIHITLVDKKFDGPQIFRNKNIYITGKFKHGDLVEVIAILQSYGARVSYENVNGADCVVVGDIPENVNGQSVRNAQRSHIPVYRESEFFKRYEIDEDLVRNLVS